MRQATHLDSAYRARPSPRTRLAASALAVGLVLALIWVLIRMGALPGMNGRGEPTSLVVFSTSAEREAPAKAAEAKPQQRQRQRAEPRTAPATPPPPATPPTPTMRMEDVPGFIRLTRQQYAAADVGRIAAAPADAGGTAGSDNGPAFEAGAAPGGLPLYYAEWYREPTQAETGPFMPPGVSSGWGMIACKTAPRFRVEDCRELGESLGSGIARGLRRASWQFLVRPPRKGNEAMIGVWVRTRFEIIPRTAE